MNPDARDVVLFLALMVILAIIVNAALSMV